MKFRLTMITGLSLMMMLTGLYLAFTGHGGPADKQVFFTLVGILGWWCGNKLKELEERLDELQTNRTSAGPSPTQRQEQQPAT
jgi:hypothetical protein